MTGEKEAWTVLGIRVYRFTLGLVFASASFGCEFLITVLLIGGLAFWL